MITAVDKLISTAKSYVGYIEKKSNKDLDNFTANIGLSNYTKFARDYKRVSGIDAQGQPWCDVFVDMMFVYTFGAELAKKVLGGFSAYTPTSANYFKEMNRFYTKQPKVGDVIFFKNSKRIYHTGIVYSVDDEDVHTIEGNTSAAKGVVENGGCVSKKSYSLGYAKIAGYGRPKYELVENGESEDLTMAQYEELKSHIQHLVSEVDNLSDEIVKINNKMDSQFIYNYMDSNMPDWAKPTVQKLMDKGILNGNEKGELGLTEEMLRMLVMNDRAGVYD